MDILIIADFCGNMDGKGNNRFLYLADMLCKEHEVEILTSDFNHAQKAYFTAAPLDYPFKITMVHEGFYDKNTSLRRLFAHYVWAKSVQKYLNKRKKGYVNNPVVDPLTALWSDL